MHTNAERKKLSSLEAAASAKASFAAKQEASYPNSALLFAYGQGRGAASPISELGARIHERLPEVRQRAQAQIPQAETEADRLSHSINAGSPEAVKSSMGRRMGADFSGVRFHTGAAAAAKADAMGARAYTSGADVYFGSDGFDPAVAAHELVHTAQQGMVDSSVATTEAPVGGVQMMPNPFRWLWDKTGGRAIRKHHDAMAELHEAQNSSSVAGDQTTDWNALTDKERRSWIRRNPLAYMHYMRSETARKKTENRIALRNQEVDLAKQYLDRRHNDSIPSSMLTSGANGLQTGINTADSPEEYEGTSTMDKINNASEIVDTAAIPPGVANAFQDAKWIGDGGSKAITGTLGAVNLLTGGAGMVDSGIGLKDAINDGSKMDVVDASVDLGSNTSKAAGGAASIAKAAGSEAAGRWAAGFNIISGVSDAYNGSREIHQGRMKHNAMEAFQTEHFNNKNRHELQQDDLMLRDIATQGKMEGSRQKIEGTGQLITGALDAASGTMELSGVNAAGGAALAAGNAAIKAGFAAANRHQKNKMEQKVTEQTLGISSDTIQAFQKEQGIRSYSRAKQALMKASGYESGTRAELYADQTEKRGQYLADRANNATPDAKAQQLVQGLGVGKGANGYEASDITDALGHWKSRAEIANGYHTIKKMRKRHPVAPPTPAAAAATP